MIKLYVHNTPGTEDEVAKKIDKHFTEGAFVTHPTFLKSGVATSTMAVEVIFASQKQVCAFVADVEDDLEKLVEVVYVV